MSRVTLLLWLSALACGSGTVEEVVDPACPTLARSVESLAFDDSVLGETQTGAVELRHACSAGADLTVQVVLSSGTGFSTETASMTLQPGASGTVDVTYVAADYAARATELVLITNDPVQGTIELPLSATTDPDQDGDGDDAVAAGGQDCDDGTATVNSAATESWNGVDDDCDGVPDDLTVDQVEGGWVSGGTYRALAHLGNVGLADFDGDGQPSVIVSSALGYGYGHVLDAASFRDLDDEATRYSSATWSGVASAGSLGSIGPTFADHTGDGTPDIVVHGTDFYYPDRGNLSLAVFDGSALRTGLTPDDAILSMVGGIQVVGDVISHADLDGDGSAEVIVTNRYDAFTGFDQANAGVVLIHDITGESGVQDVTADRDAALTGMNAYDYLGRSPAAADLDDDGYDDLIVGASGEDSGEYEGGMVYIVSGATSMPDGPIDDNATARIQGDLAYGYFGYGGDPVVADLTGDGRPDLVLSSAYADAVYVFSDAASVRGELDADDADVVIIGTAGPDFFGLGLAAGDFDGDGDNELAVGAPDTNGYQRSATSDPGLVYLFELSGSGPSLTGADAIGTIWGMGRQDVFGQTLRAFDLDGDGRDELLVDAPGHEDGGRLYFLTQTR